MLPEKTKVAKQDTLSDVTTMDKLDIPTIPDSAHTDSQQSINNLNLRQSRVKKKLRLLGVSDEVYSSNLSSYFPVLTENDTDIEQLSFMDIVDLDWSVPLPNLSMDDIKEEQNYLRTSSPKRRKLDSSPKYVFPDSESMDDIASVGDDERKDPTYKRDNGSNSEYKVESSDSDTNTNTEYEQMVDNEKVDPSYGKPTKKRPSHRPGRKPSASRLAAQKLITKTKNKKKKITAKLKETTPPPPPPSPKAGTSKQQTNSPSNSTKEMDSDDEPLANLVTKPQKRYSLKVTKHGIPKRDPPPKKGRRCVCNKCGSKFKDSTSIIQHYGSAHSPLKCSDCTKTYSNPLSLQKHRYTHITGGKPCADCSRTFPFESQLKEHRRSHLKLKLRCTYPKCDSEFTHNYDLKKHERTHTETELTCPDCDYTSYDNRNMKQHRHTHTGEKPYKCTKCNARFSFFMQKKCHSC